MLLGLWLLGGAARATSPCPGGRFMLVDFPLGTIAIAVNGGQVSIDGMCLPVPGRLEPSKTGTKVRATWPSCQALHGSAALKATIDGADCNTMAGVFKSRLALCFDGRCDVQRFRQPFIARRVP